MSPLDGKHRSMFAVEMAILFFGIFLKNSICESSGTNETCRQKHFLFVSCRKPDSTFYFPSEVVYRDDNGIKLCFYVNGNDRHADCCKTGDFNCNFNITGNENNYNLTLTDETLSKQDIVLMTSPMQDLNCMPSRFYSNNSGFLLNIHNCLDKGTSGIRLSQNSICERGKKIYNLTILNNKLMLCKPPQNGSTTGQVTTSGPVTSSGQVTTTGQVTSGQVTTTGPVTSSGQVTTTGQVTSGQVTTTGPVTSSGQVTTTGPVTSSGQVTTTGPVTSSGQVTTTGPVTSSGQVTTTGQVTSSGKVTTTGPVTSSGQVTTTGPVTSSGQVTTTGQVTSSGQVTTTGQVTSSGQVTTTGPVTSSGQVTTTGQVTSSGQVTTTGPVTSSGQVTTTGPVTSSGQVTTTGLVTTSHTTVGNINVTTNGLENAVNIMKNLSSYLEQTGNSTAYIKIGNIKGVVTKLPPRNQENINIGITTSDGVKIIENNNDLTTGCSRLVQIPKEASDMAVGRNGSFVGVVFFSGIYQNDSNSYFLNNEAVGIDMGTEISNLSHTIDIQFNNVDKKGNIASCRSWDGKGKEAIWITDGCRTYETNGSITCQCSHLTFFAILLSPSPGNISSSDLNSLTYITSIGCGLSMFFLAVALFMHCLIRKGKASQATKILINLFVAMFTLNLSFLTNESIANLGNFGACVTIAAVMHYTLLATFTWFFMEALHLCFNLWKHPSEIKHYMMKICVAGWVTPAVVVIAFLASGKYDYLVINTSDGNSAKMCWISDAVVHQVVNIGYYAIVFIFTFCIFIITVRQIVLFKPTTGKGQDISSIKRNSYSIIGLFFLLGITWAFAFFSYGPLRVASYYIFTILNSFQGFFLFIYYYHSSKTVGEDRLRTVSGSSTATSKTVVPNLYQ